MISKSDYILYRKHPAWLWLKKYNPDFLPSPDENMQAIIDEGRSFEAVAEKIFDDAVRLSQADFASIEDYAEKTRELIEQNTGTILQAAFIHEDYLCIADAITLTDKGFVLTEIKATTEPDKEHICDLAFQKAVIEYTGIPITKTQVLHADSEYIRHGEIDVSKLVKFTDVSVKVDKEILVATLKMREAVDVIYKDEMPSDSLRFADLGSAKDWRKIYRKLHPNLPQYSIYDLASNKGRGTDKLIAALEDGDCELIVDIPDSTKLQAHQIDQIKTTRSGGTVVNLPLLKEFMNEVEFPLYFLDYETINPAVPVFDNTWSFQQVVFQLSIHVMQEDGSLEHFEYLHPDNTNPADRIIAKLEEYIGDKGSVVVWNASFECTRHKELAKLYPNKEKFLLNLNDRVIDLEIPFSKRIYQDMKLKGRSSIKFVLPLLSPDLSYKSLNIQEGGTASRSWREAVVTQSRHDKEQVLSDLRKYCELDTYAMVEIYRYLDNLCK
ncbi:DUF2779 domain-containing protein [Candidatus Saccharibacteria bacterium]|nr:MAG: DUF2779 domain-containing protein [Candidatus Saccharibacteria bacterium]